MRAACGFQLPCSFVTLLPADVPLMPQGLCGTERGFCRCPRLVRHAHQLLHLGAEDSPCVPQ
eukprot:3985555-Prymnesium_polylepis.1